MNRAKTKSENQRARAASVRAADSYATVTRACKRITEELDEVTANSGIPISGMSDEDSLVISVTDMMEAAGGRK